MKIFFLSLLFLTSLDASRNIPLNNFQHFPLKKFHKSDSIIQTLAKVTNSYQLEETEHFRIYYGNTTPGTTAWNDSNVNGVYDYIDVLKETLELSWQKEVVELGLNAPTTDKIDVLIANTGLEEDGNKIILDESIIGYAEFGRFILNGTMNGTTPIMINDITIYKTNALDLLRITIAHEFMHILQLDYREDMNPINIWFYEGMAVWAESFVYPNIDDFIYTYGKALPSSISHGLGDNGKVTVYSTGFFFHYLTQIYGDELIKKVVEKFRDSLGNNAFYALNSVLNDYNTTLLAQITKYYYNLKTNITDTAILKLKEFLEYENTKLFSPISLSCSNNQISKKISNFSFVEFDGKCEGYFVESTQAVYNGGSADTLGFGVNLVKDESAFVLSYLNFDTLKENVESNISIYGKNNHGILLYKGWNLVATQFDVNATIFDSDGIELLWQYKNGDWLLSIPKNSQYFGTIHSFRPLEKVSATEGIWIKVSNDMELAFTPNMKGYCSMQDLKTGWNLWGNSCKNNIDFSYIDFNYSSIWGYDGANWNLKTLTNKTFGYILLDTLKSQSGYWIYK